MENEKKKRQEIQCKRHIFVTISHQTAKQSNSFLLALIIESYPLIFAGIIINTTRKCLMIRILCSPFIFQHKICTLIYTFYTQFLQKRHPVIGTGFRCILQLLHCVSMRKIICYGYFLPCRHHSVSFHCHHLLLHQCQCCRSPHHQNLTQSV